MSNRSHRAALFYIELASCGGSTTFWLALTKCSDLALVCYSVPALRYARSTSQIENISQIVFIRTESMILTILTRLQSKASDLGDRLELFERH